MLYLLKGSRVAEYRRENIDILSRPEGDSFTVTYSRRWVEGGLTVASGDGGVIVFADSPYKRFVPVRFCVIDEVEDEPHKITVRGHLGPFIDAAGRSLLSERWSERTGEDRPGLRFLFTDEDPGLRAPTTPDGHNEAWRAVVDELGSNPYFAKLTAARILRVRDAEGVERDRDEPVDVGETLTMEIELRTPAHEIDAVEPALDADPRGAAELIDPQPLPASGLASVMIRPVTAGALVVRVSLKPEPLHSCRLPLHVVAVQAATTIRPPSEPVARDDGAPAIDVRALLNHLRRDGHLEPVAWVHLHEDVLLRARPDDPDLLGDYAQHCYDAGEFAKAHAALNRLPDRTPEQSTLLLLASLRSGRDADLEHLLKTSDFSGDPAYPQFLDALVGAPAGTIHRVLNLLLDDLVADEKLMTAASKVWPKVSSVEVACRVAEKIAYLDPEMGARLLFERWPNAATAPDQPIDLLLDWNIDPRRLTAYAEARIDRAADQGDWDTVIALVAKLRSQPGANVQVRALSTAGRYLLAAGGEPAERGFEVLCEAATTACFLGRIDDAAADLAVLQAATTKSTASELRQAVEEVRAAVDAAVESSDELKRWEAMRLATEYDRLRERYEGKVVHAVGGHEPDWTGEVAANLALAKLKWHETEKKGSNNTDWVDGLPADATVVIMTDFMGHAISGPVRDKCRRSGVDCRFGTASVRGLLDALDA